MHVRITTVSGASNIDKGLDVDAVIILTDNETYAGGVHPSEALRRLRVGFVLGLGRLGRAGFRLTRDSIEETVRSEAGGTSPRLRLSSLLTPDP